MLKVQFVKRGYSSQEYSDHIGSEAKEEGKRREYAVKAGNWESNPGFPHRWQEAKHSSSLPPWA